MLIIDAKVLCKASGVARRWPQVARVTPQEAHIISSMQFNYFFSSGQYGPNGSTSTTSPDLDSNKVVNSSEASSSPTNRLNEQQLATIRDDQPIINLIIDHTHHNLIRCQKFRHS